MHTLALFATFAFLLCIPIVAQAESFAVERQRPMAATSTSPDPLAEVDALFSYGEDMERDRQALATLEHALVTDAHNYQLLWRAARASYHVGDDAITREKPRYFERGIETAQRAVAQQPTG